MSETLLAHGLGGSSDLPIPVTYALIGGAWALAASFAILLLAWKTPRLNPRRYWTATPLARVVDAPLFRGALGAASVAVAGWTSIASVIGPQDSSNALLGVFYVLVWVGLVPASLFFGPVWRIVSPVRAVYRTLPVRARRTMPQGIGVLPAVVGLFAFVWLELASSDPGSVAAVRVWCLLYVVVMLGGALVFGEEWFVRADPFEVFSDTVARLSVMARDPETRRVVLRNPLDGAATLPVRRGTVTVLAMLLGSTAFDSLAQTPTWKNLVRDAGDPVAARTLGILACVAVVGGLFHLAARATGGVTTERRAQLPGLLAHSLIPIVVGYFFAHYLTYLVEKGQQSVFTLFDPFDRGWNPLGIADASVNYTLSSHPTVVASVTVLSVVVGHVVGVTLAHDAALRLIPKRHALLGELALMIVMVLYTFLGLYLLFGA
ncbi:hypothetical protein GCM10007304_43340 [Rhodococcoides trifolii]|uniref:Fenitrothion hydrolase n=1 Tax=Rhodococcoides trifolii TaxID=908250 RepID=A0A917G656_9NOCA|nr:hypothetical protein [Rhodococcus trifolii]GGG24796.1 hypothetical protein GCM10007304_43340 [Rhodococcus trifolii]